jgi:hypothetical protein
MASKTQGMETMSVLNNLLDYRDEGERGYGLF